jgi:endogenous inhibitor of DNA gyrase (YacG/DUF329 family)
VSNPHSITTVKCANCGKVKQEANHWFLICTQAGVFGCYPFDYVKEIRDRDMPVCGQSCAQRELETWMTKQRNGVTQ